MASFVILAGCDTGSEQPAANRGLDYFPLRVGQYQIYTVNEIRYSQVSEPETLAYELKTEVVDSFKNTTGTITYVIHRSTRDDASSTWQFLDTWSARADQNEAVHVEGNISFVKLSFPLKQGSEWDGNRLNNMERDDYEILSYDVPFAAEGTTYENTVTVEQEFNDDPIVFTDIRKEVYARGIGLVYKETTQLRFCQQQTCPANALIEVGVIYKQQILDYGIL
jgi:hypothetical protein